MPVELSELMQLGLGHRQRLFVGDLPRPVAQLMGCHPGAIYLGHREFFHIAERHPEMRREEFQMIPLLIKSGSYYTHPNFPNCVSIFGELEHDNRRYMIGLKSAERGGEVWVQTMFRIGAKKAFRRIKGCTLVHGRAIV